MHNTPVNTHCPWSGDPVSEDSTIRYRGQTVAFCNPGCRDKFAAATKMFDEAIDQRLGPQMPSSDIAAYEPRAMRFDRMLSVGDVRLKHYHITAVPNDAIDGAVVDRAMAFVREHLPKKIDAAGSAHGAGYVILHRGQSDHWLLMHWWGGGDICLASLARLRQGDADFLSADEGSVHACVWEHVVVAHERDAWVRTMMTNEPDLDAYLADRLADGVY